MQVMDMKKVKLTLTEDIPEDINVMIRVINENEIEILLNRYRVYETLANEEFVVGALNSQIKKLIKDYLYAQSIKEAENRKIMKSTSDKK